jgi:hypothetical protein
LTDKLLPKEKVTVLLAEYATLRAEIVQRSAWHVQMIAAAVAILGVSIGLMVSSNDNVYAGVVLITFAIVGLAIGLLFNDQEMRKVVDSVTSLERRINELAGDELLTWETRRGLPGEGHSERWRQLFSGSSN